MKESRMYWRSLAKKYDEDAEPISEIVSECIRALCKNMPVEEIAGANFSIEIIEPDYVPSEKPDSTTGLDYMKWKINNVLEIGTKIVVVRAK